MQLAMGPLDIATPQGHRVVKLATADNIPKHHHRSNLRSHTKSQPFDADDLRRRLYVVVAEQEALKEKRRRLGIEAEAKKARKEQRIVKTKSRSDMATAEDARAPAAEVEAVVSTATTPKPEVRNKTSFAARMAEVKTGATVTTVSEEIPRPSSGDATTTTTAAAATKLKHSKSRSLQDRLRRKTSSATTIITRVEEAPTTTTSNNVSAVPPPAPAAPYRHVPQEAAAQFARTAAPNNVRRDRIHIHAISQQTALRSHPVMPDSLPPSVISGVTAPPRQRTLKRAQTDWAQIHQSQKEQAEQTPTRSSTPRAVPVERTTLTSGAVAKIERPGPPQHRHTFPFPFASGGGKSGRQGRYGEVVVENERLRKNGSLGKRGSCRNQIQRAAVLELPLENPHQEVQEEKAEAAKKNKSSQKENTPTPHAVTDNKENNIIIITNEKQQQPQQQQQQHNLPHHPLHQRVDWTQADEEMKKREREREEAQREKELQEREMEKEKKPARKTPILLQQLRRADSLWALKGKIVGSRTKKQHARESKGKKEDGVATISEEPQAEGEESSQRSGSASVSASALGSRSGSRAQSTPTPTSSSSPASPSSPSPSSPPRSPSSAKLSFLARFKRSS